MTTQTPAELKTQWMIYGANGYSAQLAAEKAVKQGLKPVLAGRNAAAIGAIADRLGLQARIFDLSDISAVAAQLHDVKIVSHCAGPFSATAEAMMRACIQAGTHYTDITGEIGVFDTAQALNAEAAAADVVLCPGVGFDVIPTDCMAHYLHQAMPDATSLTLAFAGNMSVSPGTAKTSVEGLSEGMKVRRNGQVKRVGRGYKMRDIDYGDGPVTSSVIPWGDISTAYWQTKIPNISVYTPHSGGKLGVYLFPLITNLLKFKFVQNFAMKKIEQKVEGPTAEARGSADTRVWGEVQNAAGDTLLAQITVPNGYTVTMDGILLSADFLNGYNGKGGYFTPAEIFGGDVVEKLPGAGNFTPSKAAS
jgi:short subunit dehydrogenase-like uncharacterized protein